MAKKIINKLTYHDFEKSFGEPLTDYVKNSIKAVDFSYSEITTSQYERLILTIVKTLLENNFIKSGESRIDDWNNGWDENLNLLKNNQVCVKNLMPKYFDKYNVVRMNGKFIQPIAEQFEKHTSDIVMDWISEKYFSNASHIYEFGCGTGHNLLRIRDVNKHAQLWGLDWAKSSQEIIDTVRENKIDSNIFSHNFNFFKPDYNFKLASDSIVYTFVSLEQVGTNWNKFVDYLIDQNPKLCVHIEPIEELMSNDNLLDYMSTQYSTRRNYLSKFLTGLRKLEQQDKIKILDVRRCNIGSLFTENYSVVVWQPI